MGFLGVYTALYDYQPQGDNELEIQEGELLYILEKSTDDDWWKAKKRAGEDDEDEPVGLIPSNYVEEAQPAHSAKALYDYSRQTDEEVSFSEDASITVYDTSDPDWTLVGVNGEYGFAPANYIEISEDGGPQSPSSASTRQQDRAPEPYVPSTPQSANGSIQTPAAAMAGILHHQTTGASRPSNMSLPPRRTTYTPEASDEEPEEQAPTLPRRPPSEAISPPPTQYTSPRNEEPPGLLPSPPYNRVITRAFDDDDDAPVRSPGGFHLYNISEMVSAMGKRKKMPITLGINVATGTVMLSPEKSRDGPQQEWTADKLSHYSIEGKHVFLELIRPSKSLDLHAGAKDTAQEIVSALGEIAGAARAEGLREVIEAGTGKGGQKKGQLLYDFMAQGDDEVTVAVGDEVVVLDDTKSEEWWMVRRLKNGKEGVVPSSYVEIMGFINMPSESTSGINAGRSTVEQNRLEEERLAKEASRSIRKRAGSDAKGSEVGPGVRLPHRGSSLAKDDGNTRSSQRSKRDNRHEGKSSKTRPDPSKTRTWTDRSGSFKVEAQFIGLTDGKIHLHKQNGVKIAVPVTKMAVEDLEYVELATGVSLDEDKPLSDIRRRSMQAAQADRSKAGASIEQPKPPEYDWFDFFLKAGVGPHQCERYSQNFKRDSMDQSVLPDITPEVLRTLGLKEGDILRVMKFLDAKYNRTGAKSGMRNVSFAEGEANVDEDTNGSAGGLFSGPGGALRNNTRKGRPTPAVQTSDIVNASAFEDKDSKPKTPPAEARATPLTSAPPQEKVQSGFDDDAWEVKKPAQSPEAARTLSTSTVAVPPAPSQPALTGALAELSLLSPPLQPTPAPEPQPQLQQQFQPPAQVQQPTQQPATAPQQQSQPTGANPSFFSQLPPQNTGVPQQQQQQLQQQQPQQFMPPRQRPQAPSSSQSSSLLPPPPPRPLSAPQNFPQQSAFGPPPLQPQLTGVPISSPPIAPPGYSLNELNQQRFQQQQQQFGQPQLQMQPTGFGQLPNGLQPQQTGYGHQLQPQQFGFQQQQPYVNGNVQVSPFADPRPSQFSSLSMQPSGFGQQQPQQASGINSRLPPALQPQATGFAQQQQQQPGFGQQQQQQQPPGYAQNLQPQQTGFGQQQPQQTGFGQLQPQQTGFGPLQSQQTGTNGFGHSKYGQSPPPVPPIPPMPPQQSIAPLQPQKTGPAPAVRFGTTGAAKKLAPQPTGRRANLAQATAANPFGF